MTFSLDRRGFIRRSALMSGAFLSCGVPLDRSAHAATPKIQVPTVDQVTIREITDNSHDVFLGSTKQPGLTVARTRFAGAEQGRTLQSQWGLAMHIESRKGTDTRRFLLDFGYTADVYANNVDLLNIDIAAVDALIISHGHYDHVGGLTGMLEANRPRMRKDLRLYTGGEDTFCHRVFRNPDGSWVTFPLLDRRRLRELGVEPVLSEVPLVIEGHAFTTGAIPRTSLEHVLPNSQVIMGLKDGGGCDTAAYLDRHFTADELAGKPVEDQHWHEHATCFNLGDRGLVVISSCGHAGIINTLNRAREVTGINKIHALIGGYHLAPAPSNYLRQVVNELKKFQIDHLLPMHCSGQNFIELARQEMPEKLVLCGTGSTFTFTA